MSIPARRALRVHFRQSVAPDLISISTPRLVTLRMFTRSQKSRRLVYGPFFFLSRIMVSMAPLPTFLIPDRPKRKQPSSTLKSCSLWFMHGGRTFMSISRQAFIWAMTLSVLFTSEVIKAAMNSTG